MGFSIVLTIAVREHLHLIPYNPSVTEEESQSQSTHSHGATVPMIRDGLRI